jgi:Fur family transcriptional regulator, ferric uptake regulator
VYRTLKLLKECELAREVYFADGRMYFEHHYQHPHHDHMVCTSCGHTIEFYNETIEKLQDKLAADNHFTPTRHTMVIFGYCEKCERHRRENPA